MSIFVPETPSKVKYWRSVVNNRHYLQLKENEKRVEGVKYINIYEANGNKFTWVRKDTLVAITPEEFGIHCKKLREKGHFRTDDPADPDM